MNKSRILGVSAMFLAASLFVGCGGANVTQQKINKDVPSANSVQNNDNNGEYIRIPAGSFVWWSYEGHREDDTVTYTLEAFALKKTPVTVAEFQKCVDAGGCRSKHYKKYADKPDFSKCNYNRGNDWLNHPMNCISWNGAKEYCEWIGGRLPSKEEWEYAATHNGTEHLNTKYPWGDSEPDASRANYDYAKDYSDNHSTSAVGSYSPAGDSPLGLVDMIGNVWEWTTTPYTYRAKGSLFSTWNGYVVKGGSWKGTIEFYLIVNRSTSATETESRYNDFGFRCAK